MNTDTYIQPVLPEWANLTDSEICDFTKSGVELLQSEAQTAADLSVRALERAWTMGQGLVALKERLGISGQEWQDYVTQNIHSDYGPIWKSMRLARQYKKPPVKKLSPGFRQLQIMFGNEEEPKPQPRRTERHSFVNFKASCACIRRFWRGGDLVNELSQEELDEVIEELKAVAEIYQSAKDHKSDGQPAS